MKTKYPFVSPRVKVNGVTYSSEEDARAQLRVCKKAIQRFISGEIDHPYRHYAKHVELRGTIYKNYIEAAEAIGVTPRNLRWYLSGDYITEEMRKRIEGEPE